MLKRLLRHIAALTFVLIVLISPLYAAPSDTILILPFENLSNKAEYNWIGEGFSLMLANLLRSPDLIPLEIEERNIAYERLGLTPTAILTRATAIKIGEKAGADFLVIGNYNISGEGKGRNISILCRVVDLGQGRTVGNDYNFSGPVNELQSMQGRLAWEILHQHNSTFPISREQLISRATAIPAAACESYIKAILTNNKDDKIRFLFRAISEYQQGGNGQFSDAAFTLGHIYYDDGRYKEALNWLEKIGEKETDYLEAQFYRAVAYIQLGDLDKANSTSQALLQRLPLYETFNNASIAELRRNNFEEALRLLNLAIQAAPRDKDLLFNYGVMLWRAGQYSAAVTQLNQYLSRENHDGQAYYILAKCLEKLNQKEEAATALDEAKKYLAEFAKWETSNKLPSLCRIKDHFSRAAYLRLERNNEIAHTSLSASQTKEVETLLAKAQGFFIAGRDSEATAAISDLLQLAPDKAEGYLLKGRIQERQGDLDGTVISLKAAIFWNPKLVPAHVLLARIYTQQKNVPLAKQHLSQALAISPEDRDALALQKLLESQSK